MIIDNRNRNSFKSRLPFSANFDKEKMKVSFSDGYIFDCYNYGSNPYQGYKNGSKFVKIAEGKEFDVEKGDYFYVEGSSVFKVSKSRRDSGASISGVLIWKAPSDEEGDEQACSENIFLQDYESNRETGFSIKKIKEENDQITYRINSGFVFCPQLGYSKFLKGFEFVKRLNEPTPSFLLKVSVSASTSNIDPIGEAGIYFIKELQITNVELQEYRELENEPIKLSIDGDNLNGVYYASLPNRGNVHLFFNSVIAENESIGSGIQVEVRGAKFFKNGIFAASEEFDIEPGHYRNTKSVIGYEKFRREYEEIDGKIYVTVVPAGKWKYTTECFTTGPSAIPEPPEIECVVTDDGELGEDEFILRNPQDDEFIASGEVTSEAFSIAKSEATSTEWTPINSWTGDVSVLVDGAGFKGVDKSFSEVTYNERRFKRVAVPTKISDKIPNNYTWYGGVFYLGESGEDISETIPFRSQDGIYISPSFYEIPHSPTDGVWGKEFIKTDCEAQLAGGYANINITRQTNDYWQIVEMALSANSIA